MLKWAYILFFSLVLLLKPMTQFGWEVWYAVNQEYVAEELCENTDKPELECNGKCYLAQQLEKSEVEKKKSSDEPVQPLQVTEEYWDLSEVYISFSLCYCEEENKRVFKCDEGTLSSFHAELFRPPPVLS